jgi:hypothetical protein
VIQPIDQERIEAAARAGGAAPIAELLAKAKAVASLWRCSPRTMMT